MEDLLSKVDSCQATLQQIKDFLQKRTNKNIEDIRTLSYVEATLNLLESNCRSAITQIEKILPPESERKFKMTTNLNDAERAKVKELVDKGVDILRDIDSLKTGLSDTVKAIGEELDIKPAILNKAIRAAFKDSIRDDRDTMDSVETILHASGRL